MGFIERQGFAMNLLSFELDGVVMRGQPVRIPVLQGASKSFRKFMSMAKYQGNIGGCKSYLPVEIVALY